VKIPIKALLFCFLTLTAGCSTPPPGPRDLASPLGRDHPLASKIWDIKAHRFITPDDLAANLAKRDYVILGEIHDNPDHHKLQAWLVQALADHNRKPAIAFEMIGLDKAEALQVYQQQDRQNADGLDIFLDWKSSGWPDWKIYKPIADTALKNGLKIVASNLPENLVKNIVKQGKSALPQTLSQRLNLPANSDAPQGEAMREAMAEDIRSSHCDALPEKLVQPFVEVQFLRDAVMAASLVENNKGEGSVLIAGQGHGRNDYGVPWHLRKIAPKKSVATVAFIEVEGDKPDVSAYAGAWQTAELPFDYIWFTPRQMRADPCYAFRKKAR
jgi:uncharacterized iron-regulated protein